jgi:hypothetical protein
MVMLIYSLGVTSDDIGLSEAWFECPECAWGAAHDLSLGDGQGAMVVVHERHQEKLRARVDSVSHGITKHKTPYLHNDV